MAEAEYPRASRLNTSISLFDNPNSRPIVKHVASRERFEGKDSSVVAATPPSALSRCEPNVVFSVCSLFVSSRPSRELSHKDEVAVGSSCVN